MSQTGPTPTEAEPATRVEPPQDPPVATPAEAPADACPRCGTPLREGQEWCLNCGAAARTRIAGASGWRTPVAIGAAVIAIALAALVLAFLAVSGDPDEVTRIAETTPGATPAPGATPVPGATPAPAAPPTAPTPAPAPAASPAPAETVGSWPDGKDGWTIVRLSTEDRAAAQKRADDLAADGKEVGLLDSDDFSSLRGGFTVVFSGTYDSSADAEEALDGLGADAGGAYVRRITPD